MTSTPLAAALEKVADALEECADALEVSKDGDPAAPNYKIRYLASQNHRLRSHTTPTARAVSSFASYRTD